MKEATGEGAMTVITISLVSLALILGVIIIFTLLTNQSKRAKCENSGGTYSSGECIDSNGNLCTYDSDSKEYICG